MPDAGAHRGRHPRGPGAAAAEPADPRPWEPSGSSSIRGPARTSGGCTRRLATRLTRPRSASCAGSPRRDRDRRRTCRRRPRHWPDRRAGDRRHRRCRTARRSWHRVGTRHPAGGGPVRRARLLRVVVVLGGDGTCRDVAIGWREAPMIAVSTGTNNVFPAMVDATSAGTAAGLIASGAMPAVVVGPPHQGARRHRHEADGSTFDRPRARRRGADRRPADTGARAVVRAESIRAVVAAIASPASTGLSSIAGRLHPLHRYEPGAVVVRLGAHGRRRVRAPIMPGHFDTLTVTCVEHVGDGVRCDSTALVCSPSTASATACSVAVRRPR